MLAIDGYSTSNHKKYAVIITDI